MTLVAGFSLQLAAGRSSFLSPRLVPAHALVFFGWVVLYVTQNALVVSQGRDRSCRSSPAKSHAG